MRPAQPDLLDADQRAPRPTTARPRGRRAGPSGRSRTSTRSASPGSPSAASSSGATADACRRLAGEDLELGGAVGVERPVAVEVVLGEVEQHRRRRARSARCPRAGTTTPRRRSSPSPAVRLPASVESAVPTFPTTSDGGPPRGAGGRSARPSSSCRWSRSPRSNSFGTSRQPISSSPTTRHARRRAPRPRPAPAPARRGS